MIGIEVRTIVWTSGSDGCVLLFLILKTTNCASHHCLMCVGTRLREGSTRIAFCHLCLFGSKDLLCLGWLLRLEPMFKVDLFPICIECLAISITRELSSVKVDVVVVFNPIYILFEKRRWARVCDSAQKK